MKVFKNPVTGETFEDILTAKRLYCNTHPCTPGGCKFHEATNGGLCTKWAQDNPEEAAELMGLVVEETPTELRDTPTEELVYQKPLSEWTLGEAQAFCKKRTESQNWEGLGAECEGCLLNVVCAITASEWDLKEAPRLTEPEIAIMRAVGAKWVSLDTSSMDEAVALWSDKPENDESGDFCSPLSVIAIVTADLFPSVKPGDCIGPIDTSTTAMSGN